MLCKSCVNLCQSCLRVVSKKSQSCPKVVIKLSHSCLKDVPGMSQSRLIDESNLSQSCLKLVPKLSQNSFKVVQKLPQNCPKVVNYVSTVKVVPKLSLVFRMSSCCSKCCLSVNHAVLNLFICWSLLFICVLFQSSVFLG